MVWYEWFATTYTLLFASAALAALIFGVWYLAGGRAKLAEVRLDDDQLEAIGPDDPRYNQARRLYLHASVQGKHAEVNHSHDGDVSGGDGD